MDAASAIRHEQKLAAGPRADFRHQLASRPGGLRRMHRELRLHRAAHLEDHLPDVTATLHQRMGR